MSNHESVPSELIEVTALDQQFSMKIHGSNELLSNIIREKKRYSQFDLVILQQFLKPGGAFLDAGANIGWYSLYGANIVGPSGKVWAFEPDPTNAELLRQNSALQKLSQIHVIEKALTDEDGRADLLLNSNNHGDHQVRKNSVGNIETVSLDHWMKSDDFQQLQLLKIDIQGSEPQMLAGMKQHLKTHRPAMYIEFSPSHMYKCGNSPFEIFAFIEKYNYIPYRVHDDRGADFNQVLEPVSVPQLFQYTAELRSVDYGIDLLLVPEGNSL
jgi:methyltransferase, FkbM family